jgi:multidrug efflux pump subunit AcrA (membrane-fusion protein)
VLDRKVSLGQLIGPPLSGHLFTLAGDLDVLRVEAQVAEGDIVRVIEGQRAEFTLSSGNTSRQFRGKVTEVRPLPAAESGAVFYKVLIEVPNERDPAGGWRLRPGLTTTVDIVQRRHGQAWKVPTAALNFRPEESEWSEAVRAKLERWRSVKGRELWETVWVVGAGNRPWPVFVRTGGTNARGDTGIRDSSFAEVLEWDPELSPRPEGGKPATYPQVIIAVPPGKQGLFDRPTIRF